MRAIALGVFLGTMLMGLAGAQAKERHAPELQVDEWVHLPEGEKEGPKLHGDWKGKVVYLYFFQSWCPGCHSSGFPTLKAMQKKFSEEEDIRFAVVQTVFEGFGTNTVEAAKRIVAKYDLEDLPVGQSGTKGRPSRVMRDFATRGTPWTVVIGKDGVIRYEGFHLKPEEGKQLLEKLKAE